jgi:hypothetical protein
MFDIVTADEDDLSFSIAADADLTGGKRSHFVFADFIQSVPDPRTSK